MRNSPSLRRLNTYLSIWKSQFLVPKCTSAANIIWMSASFCESCRDGAGVVVVAMASRNSSTFRNQKRDRENSIAEFQLRASEGMVIQGTLRFFLQRRRENPNFGVSVTNTDHRLPHLGLKTLNGPAHMKIRLYNHVKRSVLFHPKKSSQYFAILKTKKAKYTFHLVTFAQVLI